jgi:integrase
MEFRPGAPERRKDRRICPKCQKPTGSKETCPGCNRATEARIQISWYVDGKRQRELTTCTTEREAAGVLQRKESDYWRQQELGVTRAVGGSLAEAAEAYLASTTSYSPDYRKQLRAALQAFKDGLGGDTPVQVIARSDFEQFREDGLLALSSASVRSYLLVLRRFFAYLVEEGWIRISPAVKIKLPIATPRVDHLQPHEVLKVLEAFRTEAPALYPIAAALMLGGWRKGEIVNLRWKDVHLESRWAYVLPYEGDDLTSEWDPKTESSTRAVPLHSLVVEALAKQPRVIQLDGKPSPWVFPVADPRRKVPFVDSKGRRQPAYGERRSPATTFFGLKLRKVLEAAGVTRHVTVHGLRRTFAVLLQEAGAPDSVIRQALGHRGKGVTEFHYLPRRDDLVQRWVDRIVLI